MYTLVVVDMQPGFNAASGERVRNNCLREIKLAIEKQASIIFLEYKDYQETYEELTAEIKGDFDILMKADDDGSSAVEKKVHQKNLFRNFKVCGINTDCCVLATVRGLTARFPMANIEVIADACASDWFHGKGLEAIRKLSGHVKVTNF